MKPTFLRPGLLLLALLGCAAPRGLAESAPRINHVAFYVRDLQASSAFYRDLVGLETIPEPFHDGLHTWFRIGPGCALHIIAGAEVVLPKDKHAHLCFSVPSTAAFTLRLKAAHVAYENLAGEKSAITHRPDGVQQIYLQDPDGYWIEINDAKQ